MPADAAVGSAAAAPASLTGRLTSMFGLEDNPYFSAGFALGVAGTGLAAVRGASRAALTLAQRHLLVTLEVTSKDKSYPWVLQWLTEQAQVGGGAGGGSGALRQHVSVDTVVQRLANGKVETRFEFSPCPGRHVLRYRGQMLMVERQREQQTVDLQTGQPWESVKLTALGRSPEVCFLNPRSVSFFPRRLYTHTATHAHTYIRATRTHTLPTPGIGDASTHTHTRTTL
jgi:hypothetical protein